jgi:hypothetical protein
MKVTIINIINIFFGRTRVFPVYARQSRASLSLLLSTPLLRSIDKAYALVGGD